MMQMPIEMVREIAVLLEQDIKIRQATLSYLESLQSESKSTATLEEVIHMEDLALEHTIIMLDRMKALLSQLP